MLFIYHLYILSDFVTDPYIKYIFGISAISLVTIDIIWVTIAWARDKVNLAIWKVKLKFIYEPKMEKFLEKKRKLEY